MGQLRTASVPSNATESGIGRPLRCPRLTFAASLTVSSNGGGWLRALAPHGPESPTTSPSMGTGSARRSFPYYETQQDAMTEVLGDHRLSGFTRAGCQRVWNSKGSSRPISPESHAAARTNSVANTSQPSTLPGRSPRRRSEGRKDRSLGGADNARGTAPTTPLAGHIHSRGRSHPDTAANDSALARHPAASSELLRRGLSIPTECLTVHRVPA
jgi:hypothetical protein